MRHLLGIIAAALARRIERGSGVGAAIGALLGIVLGIALAYASVHAEFVGAEYVLATYILFPVSLAILGALIGAATGPRRGLADSASHVRLTRYNRAAGTLAVTIMFAAVVVGIGFSSFSRNPHPEKEEFSMPVTIGIGIVCLTLFALGVFRCLREVWLIDLGDEIRIRRLLQTRTYSFRDVLIWGFPTRPGKLLQRAFQGEAALLIRFRDGTHVQTEVEGEDSQKIVDRLSAVVESPGMDKEVEQTRIATDR